MLPPKSPVPHAERAHAANSPSSLWLRELCPASRGMTEAAGLPRESSPAARRGEILHECMERYFTDPRAALEHLAANAGETEEGDEEVLRFAASWADILLARLGPGAEVMVEQQLDLSHLGPGVEKGTADLVVVASTGQCHLVDWKFGRSFVSEPRNNLQMQAYASGVARAEFTPDVTAHVVLPTKAIAMSGILDSSTLAEAERQIKRVAEATYAQPARFSPGAHCARCDGAAACPVASRALAEVQCLVVPADIPTERLVGILDLRDTVRKVMEDAEKIAKARLLASEGAEMGGWYLANAGTDRRWADEVEVGKKFADHELRGDLLRVKPVTPAQAEKILVGQVPQDLEIKTTPRARALRKRNPSGPGKTPLLDVI